MWKYPWLLSHYIPYSAWPFQVLLLLFRQRKHFLDVSKGPVMPEATARSWTANSLEKVFFYEKWIICLFTESSKIYFLKLIYKVTYHQFPENPNTTLNPWNYDKEIFPVCFSGKQKEEKCLPRCPNSNSICFLRFTYTVSTSIYPVHMDAWKC